MTKSASGAIGATKSRAATNANDHAAKLNYPVKRTADRRDSIDAANGTERSIQTARGEPAHLHLPAPPPFAQHATSSALARPSNPWLDAIMENAPIEICIFDAATGALIQLNRAAANNLQYAPAELIGQMFAVIAPSLTVDDLQITMQALEKDGITNLVKTVTMVRKNGSAYPSEQHFFLSKQANQNNHAVLIAAGRDLSERQESTAMLGLIETRFRAIVSNTPGLVYQFRRMPDGAIAFLYLSEACHALLGIDPEHLAANPGLLFEQILADDRASYLASMLASADAATDWNWEGRIWIEAWRDIKWINLRATPRLLSSGGVQWEGIMTNITQSKLEETEIKQSRSQLAELSAHIERVKEQERTRIAREIHDDLGGNLTAIKMALALLKRRLPADETLADKADYVDSLVDRTIEAIHRISVDLRPGILDFGIVAAIDWQAQEFEKQVGIPCQVLCNKKEITLSTEQASALFRIFQESLTNISKHANASRVTVKLTRRTRSIRLDISDNGRGIAAHDQRKPKSFGIRGMIERANALGGTLTVTNRATGGSTVAIRIPLPLVTASASTA